MSRLDKERQLNLEPKRIEFAKQTLQELGYEVTETDNHLWFILNGNRIMFFPYSGWFTGKGINDGRGFKNLLKQLQK